MKVGERYLCDVPGCAKSFSRSDHLSRHKSNHDPRSTYPCSWPGCSKLFVRKDVREKHEYYHRRKLQKQKLKLSRLGMTELSDVIDQKHTSIDHQDQRHPEGHENELGNIAPDTKGPANRSNSSESELSCGSSEPFYDTQTASILPTDLTQWLFNDNIFLNQSSSTSPMDTRSSPGTTANRMLEEAFCISPNFPQPSSHTFDGDVLILKLCLHIPQLRDVLFDVDQLRLCLDVYWSIYHVQFPILHRPSFIADQTHPYLLLTMIMMGAGLANASDASNTEILPDPQQLADCIAVPLRWLISSADEFGLPTKAWMIQSLVILESYEILCSNRKLHERAYLHHGLKIQLLRRSPLLGGDPLNRTSDDTNLTDEKDIWKKWIEIESMKRAALVSFYLDTIHAIIYGHEIVLFAHQIKLLMPCDEMLWEMSVIDKNNLPPQTETPRFIIALTKLLHEEQSEVSSLSKKLLLAGLLTIKFQMEQKDLQMTFLDWKSVEESWKSTLYKAIEVWRDAVCPDDCCHTRNSFYLPPTSDTSSCARPGLALDDTKCKFPIYHLCQAFMRIKQYDVLIYSGLPKRISVKTTERDYKLVETRINQWANSSDGKLSVLHCYMFLNEMMFDGDMESAYEPQSDPILYRPNIVASSLFVIWAYNYCLYGPQSYSHENLNPQESGYGYISRICKGLLSYTGESSLNYKNIKSYAKAIDSIDHTNRMVGLLKLYRDNFILCKSEICREYSDLLQYCILRSTGEERDPFT